FAARFRFLVLKPIARFFNRERCDVGLLVAEKVQTFDFLWRKRLRVFDRRKSVDLGLRTRSGLLRLGTHWETPVGTNERDLFRRVLTSQSFTRPVASRLSISDRRLLRFP